MPFHGRSSERKIRVPEVSSNQYGRCPQNPSQLLTSLTRFNILGGVPTLPKRQLPVPRQHRGASLLLRIGFPPACVTSPAMLKLGQHRGTEGLAAGAHKITPPTHSLTLILRYTRTLSVTHTGWIQRQNSNKIITGVLGTELLRPLAALGLAAASQHDIIWQNRHQVDGGY
jgi:hypothetical protein